MLSFVRRLSFGFIWQTANQPTKTCAEGWKILPVLPHHISLKRVSLIVHVHICTFMVYIRILALWSGPSSCNRLVLESELENAASFRRKMTREARASDWCSPAALTASHCEALRCPCGAHAANLRVQSSIESVRQQHKQCETLLGMCPSPSVSPASLCSKYLETLAQWASLNPQGPRAPNGPVTRLALECARSATRATCVGSSLITIPSPNGTFPHIMSYWFQMSSVGIISCCEFATQPSTLLPMHWPRYCEIFRGMFIWAFVVLWCSMSNNWPQLSANSAAPLPTGRQTFRGAHSVMAFSAWHKSKRRDEVKAVYVENVSKKDGRNLSNVVQ